MDERIFSQCASLPKEQGSSDNLLMKAIPQTYQNLGFTLLPRANQSSWLFIVVAAVVVYLVLPPLLLVIVSSIMPPAEEPPRIPTLANFTSIFESFSDFKLLLWNSLVFSIGSSAWALVFGTALAWLAERTNARFRGVALLFTDFLIGPDGQKLMEDFRYGVSWKAQPFKREYPERGMTVAEYHKAEKQWGSLLRTLTRR